MSITTYTSDPGQMTENVDSVVPFAIDHAGKCPHGGRGTPDITRTELTAECISGGPNHGRCRIGYRVEQFRGRVVGERERNMHDDSDFFARIANEDGSTFEVLYATTRGWTYFNGCKIDASDELKAKAAKVGEAARKKRLAAFAAEREAVEASMPTVGKTVRVKSKRSKVPHGTEGEVVWFGVSNYARPDFDRYRNPMAGLVDPMPQELRRFRDRPGDFRVGILQADGGKLFVSATCVEII